MTAADLCFSVNNKSFSSIVSINETLFRLIFETLATILGKIFGR